MGVETYATCLIPNSVGSESHHDMGVSRGVGLNEKMGVKPVYVCVGGGGERELRKKNAKNISNHFFETVNSASCSVFEF